MNRKSLLLTLSGALALCAVVVGTASGGPFPNSVVLTISATPGNGLISFPTETYTMAQLEAVPGADQATDTVTIDGKSTTESGPLVSYLLTQAGLQYLPNTGSTPPSSVCKNDELRYWVEASSWNGAAAEFTTGEIDPFFGDNQAILSINENGGPLLAPRLIMPKDATDARDIPFVSNLTVGRAAPQLPGGLNGATNTPGCTPAGFEAPVATPPTGSVTINGDVAHPLTLDYAQLAALPQVTQTDTFMAKSSETNTYTGPTLFDVLSAAEPEFRCYPSDDLRFYVEVTSNEDAYAALVSWAEIDPFYNGNQTLLALSENGKPTTPTGTGDTDPILTVPGDVHGGRYVSGAAVITVFRTPDDIGPMPGCVAAPPSPFWPTGPQD